MKKYVLSCIMVIILIIAGCSGQKADKERKNKNTVQSKPIRDHADQWSKMILENNKLKVDLNDDGEKDDIKILLSHKGDKHCGWYFRA